MGKLFKRKTAAPRDYTQAMLPHSRKEIFFDVLKLNWRNFVILGSIFFLFCLPLFLLSVTETLIVGQLRVQMENLQAEALTKAMIDFYGTKSAGAFLKVPCLLLVFVALAGMSRVIRQYAWEENVFFRTDFTAGVRSNLGQMLLLGLLIGLVYAINVYNYYTALMAQDSGMAIVFVPMGVALLVGLPVAAYSIVIVSIYKTSFKNVLHMGLLLYGQAPVATLLALVCCILPFGILLIPNFLVMVIGGFLLCILFPVVFLGWYLFTLEQLDRAINAKLHPELVAKGTAPAQADNRE